MQKAAPPGRLSIEPAWDASCAHPPLFLSCWTVAVGLAFPVEPSGQAHKYCRSRSLECCGLAACHGAPGRTGSRGCGSGSPCSTRMDFFCTGPPKSTRRNCRSGGGIDHECPGQNGPSWNELSKSDWTIDGGQASKAESGCARAPSPYRRRGDSSADISGSLSTAFVVNSRVQSILKVGQ